MSLQIARCSVEPIAAPGKEFRVLPAGHFAARDGRPQGLDSWYLDRDNAMEIVRACDARKEDILIDYEHQSVHAAKNGQPAPAAGWFKRCEWREGKGLYVTDARWTERASSMITGKEYRFISPVFQYDETGKVVNLINVALTNSPAIEDLTQVASASGLPILHLSTAEQIAAAAVAHQRKLIAAGTWITTEQAVAHVSRSLPALAAVRQVVIHQGQKQAPEDIATAALAYQADMSKKGVLVTTVQAVAHVSQSPR